MAGWLFMLTTVDKYENVEIFPCPENGWWLSYYVARLWDDTVAGVMGKVHYAGAGRHYRISFFFFFSFFFFVLWEYKFIKILLAVLIVKCDVLFWFRLCNAVFVNQTKVALIMHKSGVINAARV